MKRWLARWFINCYSDAKQPWPAWLRSYVDRDETLQLYVASIERLENQLRGSAPSWAAAQQDLRSNQFAVKATSESVSLAQAQVPSDHRWHLHHRYATALAIAAAILVLIFAMQWNKPTSIVQIPTPNGSRSDSRSVLALLKASGQMYKKIHTSVGEVGKDCTRLISRMESKSEDSLRTTTERFKSMLIDSSKKIGQENTQVIEPSK